MLLPQDVLVALKLALRDEPLSYAQLAHELGLSPSQAHAAVQRAGQAKLLDARTKKVNRAALAEFLLHGLKYMCPAQPGPVVRGLPTAHSAPPLCEVFADAAAPVVWPDPEGDVRGESIEPLYKSAPAAARRDPDLYASLALLDAIRSGRARERQVASEKLKRMILGG